MVILKIEQDLLKAKFVTNSKSHLLFKSKLIVNESNQKSISFSSLFFISYNPLQTNHTAASTDIRFFNTVFKIEGMLNTTQ